MSTDTNRTPADIAVDIAVARGFGGPVTREEIQRAETTPAFEIPALALSEHVLAHHVEPGTPYEDDPTQTVPAGWWVLGNNGDHENDFEIHIGAIEDANGNDVAEPVAKLLAAALQEASNRGSEIS